jgi:hypothetical protein
MPANSSSLKEKGGGGHALREGEEYLRVAGEREREGKGETEKQNEKPAGRMGRKGTGAGVHGEGEEEGVREEEREREEEEERRENREREEEEERGGGRGRGRDSEREEEGESEEERGGVSVRERAMDEMKWGLACPGTQFTCFTSTKVQILTPEELHARSGARLRWVAEPVDTQKVPNFFFWGGTSAPPSTSIDVSSVPTRETIYVCPQYY